VRGADHQQDKKNREKDHSERHNDGDNQVEGFHLDASYLKRHHPSLGWEKRFSPAGAPALAADGRVRFR
jgi:hypothetical protein